MSREDKLGLRGAAGQGQQPFDHWLHKQLHELYDSVAKEPLPDDLVRLIDHETRENS
jgi:hypothetical protein